MKKAILYLEDGVCFEGQPLAVEEETTGEVVFNTAMSGYQEVLTDPSYAGQIVVMTYPLIGNYGVNEEDIESSKVHVKGFIVKEFCRKHSNFRATKGLIDYLNESKILAEEGVDEQEIPAAHMALGTGRRTDGHRAYPRSCPGCRPWRPRSAAWGSPPRDPKTAAWCSPD